MKDKVPASLCITCYNQERFIREAVQSAFDQTYSPLEIVISDDASTDRTAQIVQEMIAAYKGPHKVVFNRNDTNLFVAKNYEKAFKLAHGEILVTGAGDDISMPERVEKIMQAYLDSGRRATVISHGSYEIDINGNIMGEARPGTVKLVRGAAIAYHCAIVKKFGDIPVSKEIHEDQIFTARALLFGDVFFLNELLVKYRIGAGLSNGGDFLRRRLGVTRAVAAAYKFTRREIDGFKGKVDPARWAFVDEIVEFRRRRYAIEEKVLAGRFFWDRFAAWRCMTFNNGFAIGRWDKWVSYGRHVPPFGLGALAPIAAKLAMKLRLGRAFRKIAKIFRK